MALFDRSPDWSAEFGRNILGFCSEMRWTPTGQQVVYLLQAERGYRRIGMAEPLGFDDAAVSAAIVLWRMMTRPDSMHLVLAPSTQSALRWFQAAKQMMSMSHPTLNKAVLFSEDNLGFTTFPGDELRCIHLDPRLLDGTPIEPEFHRPTTVVTLNLDRCPTARVRKTARLVDQPGDLWITNCQAKK